MKFVRIRSYQNQEFTSCEHVYAGDDHVKALERFRREYPEHDKCILIAETVDEDIDNPSEWFQACSRCGCVH